MDAETIAALERLRRSAETAHLAPSCQVAVGIYPHEARAILALIERERNGGERAQIVAQIADEVKRMKALQPNWDGYGAEPIAHEIVDELVNVLTKGLPRVQFVPGADGSVQAEWHTTIASIELCVTPAIAAGAHQPQIITGQSEESEHVAEDWPEHTARWQRH